MASLDPQYPGGESNIKGSRGRPIKREGLGLRDAMRGYDVPLRDRVKARNLDQRAAKAGWRNSPAASEAQPAAGAGGGGTVAASGNLLNQRQNLFRSMEKAGAGGITPEMREQARRLGVADADFNAAAGRIRENELYTPQRPTAATPPSNSPSPSPTNPAAPKQPAAPTPPAPPSAGPLVGPPSPINSLTGMRRGTLPGDDGYTPNAPQWRNVTKSDPVIGPPAPQTPIPAVPTESPMVKQARQLKDLKQGIDALRPSLAPKPTAVASASPASPVASQPVAQNVAPVTPPQPKRPTEPVAPPKPAASPSQVPQKPTSPDTVSQPRQTAMTSMEDVQKSRQQEIESRQAAAVKDAEARRQRMAQAANQMNAQASVPKWMEGTGAGKALKWLQRTW